MRVCGGGGLGLIGGLIRGTRVWKVRIGLEHIDWDVYGGVEESYGFKGGIK